MNILKSFMKRADQWTAVFCCFYLVWLTYTYSPVENNRAIIHDVTSYYGYLPAQFIYNDIDFGFADTMPVGEPLDALWYNSLPNGQRFQKMTLGLAYFFTPTFFMADYYVLHHPEWNRNGFSKPYQWAMALNTLFFGLLCVWVLRGILKLYFNPVITALTLLMIFCATNLPYYISMAPGLSHVYSFALLGVQWLCLDRFKKNPTGLIFFVVVLTSAWLVLIRPTNLLPAMLPLFLVSPAEWFRYLKAKPIWLFWALMAFLIIWLPQFIYWKHVSGNWIFYSYDNERFYFNDPKIIEGLFSFRKGWLIYTPVMVFAWIGIGLKNEKLKPYKRYFLIVFPLYLYIVFSWWCWWYGGSYGSRVMIEFYPVLAVFLALYIRFVSRYRYASILTAACFCFMMYLNHVQMRQYHGGILHWDSMTFKAYKAIFADRKIPVGYEKLLNTPDYEAAKKGKR